MASQHSSSATKDVKPQICPTNTNKSRGRVLLKRKSLEEYDQLVSSAKRQNCSKETSNLHKQIKKVKVEPTTSTGSKNAVNKIEPYIPTQKADLWKNEDAVAEFSQVPLQIAKNVMTLFDQDCTVPFIVRYRKKQSGHLPAEKIREIQITYENIKSVRKKVDNILKTVGSSNVDMKIITAIKCAKTLDEVEYLYAPLKPGNKRTLAERAKNLGLEPLAQDLLDGKKELQHLYDAIDPKVRGKNNLPELQKGVQNIISDIIAKDMKILDFIRKHPSRECIQFHSQKSVSAVKADKKAFVEGKHTKNFKYENYFDFRSTVGSISAHQVMAINRGEALKILTVKLIMPPRLKSQIMQKCHSCFDALRCKDGLTQAFIDTCVKDAYDRLLEPHTFRQIRSDLTKKAAHESVEIFCANLKRLLLSPPVRGKSVLGVDPGFTHGCKLAALSFTGDILETGVIHPHSKFSKKADDYFLIKMVLTHKITLIAIGNGTACRETETWISELIKNKAFHPHNVKYCIVDESGVSIYSVSKESELEHPGLDPNLRSAVAIARRLQDPLLEYVKVEPKHLGIGMYQHDIPDSVLKTALTSVVVECVSFVGVDLNVCPEVLLQKISGLSSAKAKSIIEWREKNAGFINVHQLLEVKGLGPKSFEQCAGFVKILPQTAPNRPTKNLKTKSKKLTATPNPLDMTIIHPESYQLAERFLAAMDTDVHEVGKQSLTEKVKNLLTHTTIQQMALKLGSADEQIQIIIDAFLNYNFDIRDELELPIFKTGVSSLADLTVNQQLTGRVMNVTNFGAFVDIGVGRAGLVHVSQMRDTKLQLGDRVNVRVLSVDVAKERISLQLVKT